MLALFKQKIVDLFNLHFVLLFFYQLCKGIATLKTFAVIHIN
jgi:hypothetical protein